MALFGKSKKNQGAQNFDDEGDDALDWDITSDLDTDADEDSGQGSGFDLGGVTDSEEKEGEGKLQLNTLQVEADTEDSGDEESKEKPGIVSAIASDGAEKDGAEKGGDPSGVGGLMDIFDEEIVVDKQLETLNSWVEEVDAEELVDELRSLMEELGNLTNKI